MCNSKHRPGCISPLCSGSLMLLPKCGMLPSPNVTNWCFPFKQVPFLQEDWEFLEDVDSVQFSSVAQSCPTLCDPINRSTPGLPLYHQLLESTQTHIHWVGDAIKLSHPLSSPSLPALNLSQHQGLFKWVSSSHQAAKVLEFQLQHQSFQ